MYLPSSEFGAFVRELLGDIDVLGEVRLERLLDRLDFFWQVGALERAIGGTREATGTSRVFVLGHPVERFLDGSGLYEGIVVLESVLGERLPDALLVKAGDTCNNSAHDLASLDVFLPLASQKELLGGSEAAGADGRRLGKEGKT